MCCARHRTEAVEAAASCLWLTEEANGSYLIPLLDLYDEAVAHERARNPKGKSMMKKILLLVLVLVGCAPEPASPQRSSLIRQLDQREVSTFTRAKTNAVVTLFEVDGHKYVVASMAKSDGGIAILHAASCYCWGDL